MSRLLMFAILFATFGTAGRAHAQSPVRVWIYGDGNSTRMFSELEHLPGFNTGLDIKNHGVESSGPAALASLIAIEFWNTPRASWPQVVLIGYSASALSLQYCASGYSGDNVAAEEASYILSAALWLKDAGVKVLLSLGPGVPDIKQPGHVCMERAFSIVNAFVAQAGFPTVNWSLTRTERNNWAFDSIHVSCDRAYFKTTFKGEFCGIVGPDGKIITNPPRAGRPIGALITAQRVLTALQAFR